MKKYIIVLSCTFFTISADSIANLMNQDRPVISSTPLNIQLYAPPIKQPDTSFFFKTKESNTVHNVASKKNEKPKKIRKIMNITFINNAKIPACATIENDHITQVGYTGYAIPALKKTTLKVPQLSWLATVQTGNYLQQTPNTRPAQREIIKHAWANQVRITIPNQPQQIIALHNDHHTITLNQGTNGVIAIEDHS